ncbi:hypothetical protein ccbrp13_06850 [Ktedonobacteria bacterium brp13]|nr:hypothetical protein ccbrp13_06850 [Ktedonobacteria bacterium brp13]
MAEKSLKSQLQQHCISIASVVCRSLERVYYSILTTNIWLAKPIYNVKALHVLDVPLRMFYILITVGEGLVDLSNVQLF